MSSATAGELALAAQLHELGLEAHNATRARDGLKPNAFARWESIDIDQRAAWIAIARHVQTNYVFKNSDPEALVRAAGSEIHKAAGLLIERTNCDDLARLVLISAGVIAEAKAVAS
jgi:hypothetical protein